MVSLGWHYMRCGVATSDQEPSLSAPGSRFVKNVVAIDSGDAILVAARATAGQTAYVKHERCAQEATFCGQDVAKSKDAIASATPDFSCGP